MARQMISPRQMAVLAVLLGLCLSKPPERTCLSTSPSFNLPRCATSYLPRKQQRVRVVSSRTLPAPTLRASSGGRDAMPTPTRPDKLAPTLRSHSEVAIRLRVEMVGTPHPLRC